MHYNCLIVDDEDALAEATSEYFNLFDVKTTNVSTENECFNFFKNNTSDLILLDINLKKSSGFNLCKKLRETMDIPILFISARQSDDDVIIALNIGGDDYVKKPYNLSVLLAKVKVTLKRYNSNTDENKDINNLVSEFAIPNIIIKCAKLRLGQVIDNIISNSYKYAKTKIDVTSSITDNYLELSFNDYGNGINKDELPLLCQKFYRGNNSKTENGSGLGLYISKYFMNKMDGDLIVNNIY